MPPPPSQSPLPRRQKILYWLFIAGLLMAVLLAILGRGQDDLKGEATVKIDSGASTTEIARLLKQENVIKNEKDFLKKAEEIGIDGTLQAGLYLFERGEPLENILKKLQNGDRVPESILTVPEGYAITDITAEVASRTKINKDQYLKATLVDGWILPLQGATGATTLEGFLFPSTYDLDPDMTADQLITRQLEAFSRETAQLPWSKAAALGLTPYQALTVASMVEREAKIPDERPLVAAVIYNRLRDGVKLEVDATVQYALGYWKQELTVEDLEIDSRYNTRLYEGLPPGPICNPGVASIRAALEPAAVDYLYYVATGDEEGHHLFTASYEEFLQAQQGR
jgi:UPF0755 protein